MPTLDISEVFSDLFCETVTVLRRRQVINSVGRVEIVATIIENVFASVQPKDSAIGGNVIERAPDMQYRGSNLNIYTPFRLRGVSKSQSAEYQPDVVIWNGDYFLVTLTNDYTHYGAGYMHAELESMEPVDYAPDGNVIEGGRLDFSDPAMSALIAALDDI